ncbi:hypothetical protein ACFCP7_05500 [Paenibacillus elgii]
MTYVHSLLFFIFSYKEISFQLGDCVYIAYLSRTGIVFETEDARGNIGVIVQNRKFKINQGRLKLHIEQGSSKELYPDNDDLDTVSETKKSAKKAN